MNWIKYIQVRHKTAKAERSLLKKRLKRVRIGRSYKTSLETQMMTCTAYAIIVIIGVFLAIVLVLAGVSGLIWLFTFILGG